MIISSYLEAPTVSDQAKANVRGPTHSIVDLGHHAGLTASNYSGHSGQVVVSQNWVGLMSWAVKMHVCTVVLTIWLSNTFKELHRLDYEEGRVTRTSCRPSKCWRAFWKLKSKSEIKLKVKMECLYGWRRHVNACQGPAKYGSWQYPPFRCGAPGAQHGQPQSVRFTMKLLAAHEKSCDPNMASLNTLINQFLMENKTCPEYWDGLCEGDTETGPLVYRDSLRQGRAKQMWHTDTVVILSSIIYTLVLGKFGPVW